MEYASQRRVEVETFSLEVEEFFASSLDTSFIYRKLFHHRSVEAVQRREKITNAQMTKYLKKLDELGIIKWLPGDRIQFLQTEYMKFRDDGPLKDAVYKAWVPKLHKFAIDRSGDGDHVLKVFSARCSLDLRADFLREFGDLVERFIKRAAVEIKTQPSTVKPFAASLATAPLRVGLDEWDNK